jgi:hypothetical protein
MVLVRWRDTGEFLLDDLRGLRPDVRERLELISHSPELADGGDALSPQRVPSFKR